MTKSVSAKMGIRAGVRTLLVNAPGDAVDAIELPSLAMETSREGEFEYIHLFVTKQVDMHEHFSALMNSLAKTGALWLSWPKGGKMSTDLSLPAVIKIGYDYGLVESKTLSINETWSAIKFTWPREGKVYQNSFGKLRS
ncbi:hypothetical protein [Spirosoma sp. KUDC1026]|uniref:hypothetical protein n=1 Tax=Spirosoma sp. KUDC1026 TaxID=2745947 RepID=UPI00159B8E89|nr:hypothetical protein [Spirosoma sp. KUDC1026]QKZ15013.1 hypothetical protein HU175_21255 [Spirosoma sp. KUDC1026]